MTKVIIIDDEAHCTEVLANLIKKVHSDYEILGIFTNPIEGLLYIQNNPPDLLFLDIEMPNLNGFALLDKLLPIDFDIIFTTAYDRYAIRAFNYSAINYLLKPISERNIVAALANWEKRRKKISTEQWRLLQSSFEKSNKECTKIALPTGIGFNIVEIKNIMRCQSDNNYTNFFLQDGTKILISRTLKEIDDILSEHKFIRVHQSHLINPKFVKGILKQDGGSLIMSDNIEIPVSRQKRIQINEILETMLRFK
ncbi:LytTR family DNA-binding domain-containing protein [Aequorivita todarodis]|jgi:two-component system LytT family response regulator|uniref:LytR/AlgR family response regulator transcription factor n=1 Tax=Flavobacteriaceae TaxID=49546 RepID=UPI000C604801|nr:LytTR family DNA-binding domain-containing protein [Aequorivita todarodis]MAB40281.1 DNA-binding response regulator [Aequorivita sp.]MBP40661.1 DNA-binding response regulator [Aequorivita sp.]MDC8001935.1 LytTR family DNA-binding domain-containing protein [Aequorivita todarodis]HBC05704.1 DNA-binding response regulator [Aequorivita sp.]|tara:strand:- start:4415 stop:5173 length:759 start_codon:yes stop_codon:yes gene_type:complete